SDEHEQNHDHREYQSTHQAAECINHRGDLSAHGHRHALRRFAQRFDHLIDMGGCSSEIIGCQVGGEAELALHVVAVVFADHRVETRFGHVAQINGACAVLLDGHVFHVGNGGHIGLWHFQFYLI